MMKQDRGPLRGAHGDRLWSMRPPRAVLTAAVLALALPAAARTQERPATPAAASNPAPPPIPLPPRDPALPPAEEQAKESLSASPRHGEWADVKVPGVATPIRT